MDQYISKAVASMEVLATLKEYRTPQVRSFHAPCQEKEREGREE